MQTIPFSDLRTHLAETLRALERGTEPMVISRRGEPAAVLMSMAQYRQLLGQVDGPAARLAAWRARTLTPGAHEPEDDPWADVRDRSPGRPVTWVDDLMADKAPGAGTGADPADA